ncbi:MAG: hypothetical protein WDM91_13705 [Rhizomicrobium sp.]
MRISHLMAALLLAGCAPRYTWDNPSLAPGLADRQRAIDSAECTATAMRAIPLPDLPAISTTAPSGYTVSGTTTSYGPSGQVQNGYYSGTVSGGGDAAQAGANAYLLMQAGFARSAAVRAQANYAAACMMRRGWVKEKPGEQPSVASTAMPQVPETLVPAQQSSPPSNDTLQPVVSVEQPFQSFDDWRSGKRH